MEFSKPAIEIADTRNRIDTESKFNILETFDFDSLHPQLIHIRTHEFSAVCPGTGLPDIALMDIEYIPDKKAVELKSLKYYLFSYRNEAIFQEPVTDLIFDHLLRSLEPKYLKLTVKYNIRGGFDTVTVCEKGNRRLLNPGESSEL